MFRCWVPELAHLSAQERRELAIPRCSAHPSTLIPPAQGLHGGVQPVLTVCGGLDSGRFGFRHYFLLHSIPQRVPEAEANSSGRVVGSCTSGWEYDFENYHRFAGLRKRCIAVNLRSLVSDMDWVCEDAWIPAMSQVKQSLC